MGDYHNSCRVHQALEYRTPEAVYYGAGYNEVAA